MSLAEFLEILIIFAILGVIAYWGANTYFKARISRALIEEDIAYRLPSADYTKTLLVLGDSTAVGVGADKPEDTVAGRLATYIGATYVENLAKSGATTAELLGQMEQKKLAEYHYILIQTGGNDIIGFHSPRKTGHELADVLAGLPKTAKILVISAGNVGGGTLFPHPIRPIHTYLNIELHKEFARTCHAWGATYINLYEPVWKDPFLRDPNRYLSRDGLHPSSYGYGLWFDKIQKAIEG